MATEQVTAQFDLSIRALPNGQVAIAAKGNLPAPVVYANLGLIMRELETQMRNPETVQLGTKAVPFNIRRMP